MKLEKTKEIKVGDIIYHNNQYYIILEKEPIIATRNIIIEDTYKYNIFYNNKLLPIYDKSLLKEGIILKEINKDFNILITKISKKYNIIVGTVLLTESLDTYQKVTEHSTLIGQIFTFGPYDSIISYVNPEYFISNTFLYKDSFQTIEKDKLTLLNKNELKNFKDIQIGTRLKDDLPYIPYIKDNFYYMGTLHNSGVGIKTLVTKRDY